MRISKTSSGKTKIRINRPEWETIGLQQGWMKKAEDENRPCSCRECDCETTFDKCCSEEGVFQGCPQCGSKNMTK